MRLISFLLGSLVGLTGPVAADDLGNLNCTGSDPNWVLELLENQAQFRFAEATLDFEIPQTVMSEGDKGPRALTLLGDTETAIVILEEEMCRIENQDHIFEAQILTQRRRLPILLSGFSSVIE